MPKKSRFYTVYSQCPTTQKYIKNKMREIEGYQHYNQLTKGIQPQQLIIFIEWDRVSVQTLKCINIQKSFTVGFSYHTQIPKTLQPIFNVHMKVKQEFNFHYCCYCHQNYLKEQKQFLWLNSGSDNRFIPIKKIAFLKADNNYTIIYLTENRYVQAFATLKSFQQRLPSLYFERIHKSYLINIHNIRRVNSQKRQVYFQKQKTPALFSKRKNTAVQELLNYFSFSSY